MKLYQGILLVLLVGVVLGSGCAQKETESATATAVLETAATGEVKEFTMTAKNWDFSPSTIMVHQGDTVKLHIKSIDVPHGFILPDFGINQDLPPGKTVDVEFVADKAGTFPFRCSVFCGSGHREMIGQLVVQ